MLSLIKDEITILQAFEKANEVIYIINRKCEKYEYAKYNFVDIPKEELPDENEKLENPYLIEYVRQLQIEEQTKNVDIPLVFVYESDFDIIDVDLRPRIYVSMNSSAQNSKVNFLDDMIDSMIFSNPAESSSTSLVKINNMIRNQQYFGQNNEYEFYFGEEQFLKTQGREHVWKLCASC